MLGFCQGSPHLARRVRQSPGEAQRHLPAASLQEAEVGGWRIRVAHDCPFGRPVSAWGWVVRHVVQMRGEPIKAVGPQPPVRCEPGIELG